MAKTKANYNRTSVTQTHKYPRSIGHFTFFTDGRFRATNQWLDNKAKQS